MLIGKFKIIVIDRLIIEKVNTKKNLFQNHFRINRNEIIELKEVYQHSKVNPVVYLI